MPTISKQFRVSWWDRLLITIAPRWGMQRVRARQAAKLLLTTGRSYEAASGGRRTEGWRRTATDANAAIGPALSKLRELARDLNRNNTWSRRGLQIVANNTVGWGITPKAVGVPPKLAQRALEIWNQWARSVRCDYDQRLPFNGIEALVMRTVVESGECLVVRQPALESDGLSIPLRLRVLEPDYLDTSRDGIATADGNPLIQGIEFDKQGRRVAYWIFDQHPGSGRAPAATSPTSSFASRRVDARDILHVYWQERPEQMRGVPWLASGIAKLNDLDDFEDAVLMQQKVAACFAAFVQDVDGAANPLGEESDEREQEEILEPGHIAYLPPGKTVTFATPPSLSDASGSFQAGNLRRIAAGYGVTYEDLTGDYSQVNFSSARMGRLAHWSNVENWRWLMLVPQFCDPVWEWAMELAAALEGWEAVPQAEWSAPPMPMLEPEKEGLAYQRLIRSGAMTVFQMIRERGGDPRDHLNEIAEGNKLLDELGIVLDSDARVVTSFGMTQPEPAGGGGEDDAGDEDADEAPANGQGYAS